jgi:hypothetical protein
MKFSTIISALLLLGGCTSLYPVDLPPEQLQGQIAAEEMIKVGQTVRIGTSDGTSHEFEVTDIQDDHILGKDVDIAVKDIVTLEHREVSGAKTVGLAGGVAAGTYVVLILLLVAAGPFFMM